MCLKLPYNLKNLDPPWTPLVYIFSFLVILVYDNTFYVELSHTTLIANT